jgi:hypothetical protein
VVNIDTGIEGAYANLVLDPSRILGFSRRVAAAERRWQKETGKSGLFLQINTEALHVLQQDALKNLRGSIARNGRPDIRSRKANATRLEDALVDDKYSEVTEKKIALLVRSKVVDDVPYYRALEYGSRSQIGKERYFLYLSARSGISSSNFATDPARIFNRRQRPSMLRNNGRNANPKSLSYNPASQVRPEVGQRTDRIVGTRERQGRSISKAFKGSVHKIIIRRPVPAYRYANNAGRDLIDGKYESILNRYKAKFLAEYGVKLL